MSVELSVIVSAYNAESSLVDCLNSITYQDFEILLIDDGSNDGTGIICDRFQREYPQVRVFHTENRGVSSARNLGIEKACGQFVGFVDADDMVSADMYESLVSVLREDVQLSTRAFQRCERDRVSNVHLGDWQPVEVDQYGAAEMVLRGVSGPYVWNKLYRREILKRNNIHFRADSQMAENQFFNAEYLQYCQKAICINQKLYFYISTEGSITNTFRQKRVVDARYISLPRAWRYTSEIMEPISPELMCWSQAKTAMFYQTVLRKLEKPSDAYIREAVSYVKQHKNTLLPYSWGTKYYLSATILCASYRLWVHIFRKGIEK